MEHRYQLRGLAVPTTPNRQHPAVAKSVFEYADGPLVFGLHEVIAGNVEEKVIQFLTRYQVRDWTRSCLRVWHALVITTVGERSELLPEV